jgi:uncharacterized membrane-anchored protein
MENKSFTTRVSSVGTINIPSDYNLIDKEIDVIVMPKAESKQKNSKLRERLFILGIIIPTITGIITLFAIKDEIVGLASLITIFASGFAGGASLTAYIWKRRIEKRKML